MSAYAFTSSILDELDTGRQEMVPVKPVDEIMLSETKSEQVN